MLKLYNNKSDNDVLLPQLTLLYDNVPCVYIENVNDINPVYKIEGLDITNVNYIYDSTIGKYYHITSKEMQIGGIYNVSCDIDALYSNRTQILGLEETIDRNEFLKNGYLIDNDYQTYAYEQIVAKKFPNAMVDDSIILMTIG